MPKDNSCTQEMVVYKNDRIGFSFPLNTKTIGSRTIATMTVHRMPFSSSKLSFLSSTHDSVETQRLTGNETQNYSWSHAFHHNHGLIMMMIYKNSSSSSALE